MTLQEAGVLEMHAQEAVNRIVAWCRKKSILILNVNKTKETTVDFRRKRNKSKDHGKKLKEYK